MVTAALVLLAGHLRDDPWLVTIALGLSLAAVVVESVQVLRARRAAPTSPDPDPTPAEPVEPTEAAQPVETAEPVEDSSPVEPDETSEPTEPDETSEPTPDPTPVRLPGRTTYHRPECPTVRGKAVVPVEAGAEPGEVLKPCGRCRPTPLVEDSGDDATARPTA